MMAPPDVVSVFRKMQANGQMLGEDEELRPRMGIKTAANGIFVVTRIEPTDSPKEVMVTTEDGMSVRIEKELLRPLIRGRVIHAWGYSVREAIIWTHNDATAQPLQRLPDRAAKYFSRHEISETLRKRQDYKSSLPLWSVFRADPRKLTPKVCWKRLANEMQATPMNRDIHSPAIGTARAITIHTAYLIPTKTFDEAILLAAVFNSIPLRAFIMSFALRARGGYFEHFSWTVGLTPVPSCLVSTSTRRISPNGPRNPAESARILKVGRKLLGNLEERKRRLWEEKLNQAISVLYTLSSAELATVTNYYLFMRPPHEQLDRMEEEEEDET